MAKGVDIVIPIYNALDDLKLCLQSIFQHTDLKTNRLILINDNSPDERIRPFLDSQQAENVIVIHNEKNLGFSNNINLGMSQSDDRDVLLLNSDTVVTDRWLEKMTACAYSSDSIATVTPLSNNATLCSVPEFCLENTLPEGMDIDTMASVVEDCSLRRYPRITVAHGFCMLVKREVIRLIGGFDAETFGRGYGEENDFCNRAEQMGYIHVMCDDTYIYHSGTKSFISKEKEEYIRAHEKILRERYPEQMHNNDVHCRDNPNGWVGRNVALHTDIRNGRKNIFYLLQADFREGADNNVGGTQLHVKHLTGILRYSMNIFVAARNKEYLQVTAYIGDKEYLFRYHIGPADSFPVLRNRNLQKIFHNLLAGFEVDLVHVHHTASTSLDIYHEARKLNIPVIFTAHDYYYVCPGIKMLDKNGKPCVTQAQPDCVSCLRMRTGRYEKNPSLDMWRRQHKEALGICETVIVPSESVRDILCRHYPECHDKITVIPHGMDAPELLHVDKNQLITDPKLDWKLEQINKKGLCIFVSGVANLQGEQKYNHKIVLQVKDFSGNVIYLPTHFGMHPELLINEHRFFAFLPNSLFADGDLEIRVILFKDGQPHIHGSRREILKNCRFRHENRFRVAFIGGINEEKGARTITEMIKKGPDDVEWYLFGGIGDESLYQLKKDNLLKTGYYHQEDLHTLLTYHKIDAICILSKCPETFSYTLSEAVLSHLPVIVTDIGALGQRTEAFGLGKTVSADETETAGQALKVIDSWKTKGEEYQEMLQLQQTYSHPSLEDMAECYRSLYKKILPGEHNVKAAATPGINEFLLHSWDTGYGNFANAPELLQQINELENRLKIINNSITFRIVMKLTGIRIPFKKQLRSVLMKLRRR